MSQTYVEEPKANMYAPQQQQTMSYSQQQQPGVYAPQNQEPPMYESKGQIVNQPQGMPPMGVNPLNPAGKEFNANGQRDWTYGFCSFTQAFGTCCLACWCPCLVYSENKSRLRHLQYQGRPHPTGGEMCSGDCFLYGCITYCFGLGWIFDCVVRGDERSRARIDGGACTDCLAAAFCNPCAQTQLSRELDAEEKALMGQPIVP